ncbi:MAG: CopG family transcriptional regulator, partial [Deltaproteobacteria bacterium]
MNTEEFNNKFDEGQSMVDDLDLSKALRSEQQLTRISIDFPV